MEDFEKWRTGGLIDQLKAAVEEVKKEGPLLRLHALTGIRGSVGIHKFSEARVPRQPLQRPPMGRIRRISEHVHMS